MTEHPVSCIEPGLAICFTYDIIHVSMPFSQIIPSLPSPTESKRLFYTSMSLLLSCIQDYRYPLSLLVGMQTSTATMENSVEIPLKNWKWNCLMTQQSHCWAYTPRKPELKETRGPQCSLQHCL